MTNRFLPILLLLALSATLYAFIIVPVSGTARTKYKFVNNLQEVLSQAEELHRRRDELLAQKNSVPVQQREMLKRSISPHNYSEVVRFVIALETVIGRSGLGADIPYTIGREKKEENGLIVVPITFNFDRIGYADLLRFIERLRDWDRGARIVSVRILSSDSDTGTSTVRASITIEGLFLEEFKT